MGSSAAGRKPSSVGRGAHHNNNSNNPPSIAVAGNSKLAANPANNPHAASLPNDNSRPLNNRCTDTYAATAAGTWLLSVTANVPRNVPKQAVAYVNSRPQSVR